MQSWLDANRKNIIVIRAGTSNQAIKTNIILEVFLKANENGVRYVTLIADGVSSTYACIQEEVPVWVGMLKKGESVNHVCKCLRGNLEKKNGWMGTLHIKGKVIWQRLC